MKEQVFSFPMVGGKFLGIVRGLGNERLFVTNLALYVVDLWNGGFFFSFNSIFHQDVANVQHQTIYHTTSNTHGLRPSPRIGNNGHYYPLVCPLQECLISREDGKGKARDSFKVTTVFNRDT